MPSARSFVFLACLSLALVYVGGCSKQPEQETPAVSEKKAVSIPADTIYLGGDIITVNDAQPAAEALAVKDGRILAVGSRAEIEMA